MSQTKSPVHDLAKKPLHHTKVDDYLATARVMSFEHFLESGVLPKITYNGNPLFAFGITANCFLTIVNQCGFATSERNWRGRKISFEKAQEKPPIFVLNPSGVKTPKEFQHTFIMNGDEGLDYLPLSAWDAKSFFPEFQYPTISFACLTKLICKKDNVVVREIKKTAQELISGEVKILDFIGEEHIYPKKEEMKKIAKIFEKGKIPFPPKSGLTWVGSKVSGYWHRPATVVLQRKRRFFLLGQDDETYFGVELPKKVSTVGAGLKALIPSAVRGKEYQRQGEWFVVKVKEEKLPKKPILRLHEKVLGEKITIHLPVKSLQSNCHSLQASEIIVTNNGQIFVNGFDLYHEQHGEIGKGKKEGWFTFHENTALQSYSEEGMD